MSIKIIKEMQMKKLKQTNSFLVSWCLRVGLLCLLLFTGSCAALQDIGLTHAPDIDQRTGLTGTLQHPGVLDPFQKYQLVMAANECRYFKVKIPKRWSWKAFLTVVNRDVKERGRLTAEIGPNQPPWSPVSGTVFGKFFDLGHESVQAVLGVGNLLPDRVALLKLCQEGPPLRITIESQVSSGAKLMGPSQSGGAVQEE
jgi:hypothetical protein